MTNIVRLGDGRALAYFEAGQGRPLILLHAFPLDHRFWEPQVAALSSVARLIIPDLPGFGRSSVPEGPAAAIDAFADDLAELLRKLDVDDRPVIGGVSMGGYISLAFARRHPARLAGLILADTRAEPDSDDARANRNRMIEFTRRYSAAEVIDSMMPKMIAESTRSSFPHVEQHIRDIAASQSREGIIAAFQALRDRPDARPHLPAIAVPTLVVVGDDDVLTPVSAAETLATSIPRARLVRIPAAGHLANVERPDAFNQACLDFLSASFN